MHRVAPLLNCPTELSQCSCPLFVSTYVQHHGSVRLLDGPKDLGGDGWGIQILSNDRRGDHFHALRSYLLGCLPRAEIGGHNVQVNEDDRVR